MKEWKFRISIKSPDDQSWAIEKTITELEAESANYNILHVALSFASQRAVAELDLLTSRSS